MLSKARLLNNCSLLGLKTPASSHIEHLNKFPRADVSFPECTELLRVQSRLKAVSQNSKVSTKCNSHIVNHWLCYVYNAVIYLMFRKSTAGEMGSQQCSFKNYGWRNGAKFTKIIFIHIQCCYCLYSRICLFLTVYPHLTTELTFKKHIYSH